MQHQKYPAQLGQQINQIILNSSDSETVLQQIAQALGEAFRVDCCLVMVTADNQPTIQSAYWHSDKAFPAVLPQHKMLTSKEQLALVMRTGSEPLVIDDVQAFETSSLTGWRHLPLPIRAVLEIPTRFQGKTNGVVSLIRSQPYHWSESEKERLKESEAPVAIAISQVLQAKLIASLQQQVDTSAQYQEVQAKLYEKTRRQIDQLRDLNQLKDEFLSTVNHELRTPLTSMSLAIRMLRQPGLPTERQAKYLDILEQQCTQETNLINDLLALQELESHQAPLQLETLDLKPRIHDLAQSFDEQWADKGLTVTVDLPKASLLLQTDSESLERILQELLTNAGKYSDPDTTVVLRATRQVNQQVNQIVLTMTNIGSGISPEDATHIFDKFRRGQGVTQQAIQGTGLGLALVKCLVQHLNGTIAVSSSPGSQSSSWKTCFTLTLPQFLDHTKP